MATRAYEYKKAREAFKLLMKHFKGPDSAGTLSLVNYYVQQKYVYGTLRESSLTAEQTLEAERVLQLGKDMAWERRVDVHRVWMYIKIACYSLMVGYGYAKYLPDNHLTWMNPMIENTLTGLTVGVILYVIDQAISIEIITPRWMKFTGQLG